MNKSPSRPFLLSLLLFGAGLSACAGKAGHTTGVIEDPPITTTEEGRPSPEEVERVRAALYLTDELIRVEKNLVAVHFPYFVSANEVSRYIKPEDVYSAAWHYEGWSGSGAAFDNDPDNIYGQFFRDFKNNIKETEASQLEFLKTYQVPITSQEWEQIPEYEVTGFFDDSLSIENWKKYNLDTPIFYNIILKVEDKDILKLKAAHPGMKFSGTVHYSEHMEGVQKIINANEEKYFFREVPEEEKHAVILKAFEKSGLKE